MPPKINVRIQQVVHLPTMIANVWPIAFSNILNRSLEDYFFSFSDDYEADLFSLMYMKFKHVNESSSSKYLPR